MRYSITIKDSTGKKKNAASFSIEASSEGDAQTWGNKQAEAMGLENATVSVKKE